MVFSDVAFVYFFLPVSLLFILPVLRSRLAPLVILIFSLGFFYWTSGLYTLLLVFSIALNYVVGLLLEKNRKQIFLFLAIALNVLLLVHYKYAGFLLGMLNLPEDSKLLTYSNSIILPIGISFYTFQGISYIVDVWRGDTDVERDPIRFGAYLSFFPQLIAGPIVRFKDVRNDFMNPKVSINNMLAGASRFSVGLFKKVVIADTAAQIADAAFSGAAGELGLAGAWVGALAYSIQIYFDFSGYSDMALGIALMFGIRIPENFNHPYAASTITNFWRRWHISLSSWFRDYLYIPLGGNRGGSGRTYINLLIVFAVTGIWHGAAWTFMVWGLWHGAFIIVERIALGKKAAVIENKALRYLYAFPVAVFGWVMFRAETLPQGLSYMGEMLNIFEPGALNFASQVFTPLNSVQILILVGGTVAMLTQGYYKPIGRWAALLAYPEDQTGKKHTPLEAEQDNVPVASLNPRIAAISLRSVVTLLMLGCATLYIFSQAFSPFLYFRF